ncbi:MAG: hypothetical protein RIC35_23920 [Marinoscillum sp.]
MTTELIWILLLLTNLFGGLVVFMLIYILKIRKTQNRQIRTYTNRKQKIENGPVLDLPEGVVPSSFYSKTRA